MIRVRDGGSAQIAHVRVRDADNNLAEIGTMHVRDGSGLSVVFGTFSATASPLLVQGFGYSKSPITITTSLTSVTVKGGSPPYSYAWSGDPAPWSIVSPTSASTSFRRTSVGQGQGYDGDFSCLVTDSTGRTVTAGPVTASVSNSYGA